MYIYICFLFFQLPGCCMMWWCFLPTSEPFDLFFNGGRIFSTLDDEFSEMSGDGNVWDSLSVYWGTAVAFLDGFVLWWCMIKYLLPFKSWNCLTVFERYLNLLRCSVLLDVFFSLTVFSIKESNVKNRQVHNSWSACSRILIHPEPKRRKWERCTVANDRPIDEKKHITFFHTDASEISQFIWEVAKHYII